MASGADAMQESILSTILQPHIQRLLVDSKQGFSSDDEYLALLESIFSVFFIVYDSRESLSRNMCGFWDKVNQNDVDQKQRIYDGLNSLLTQLKNRMELRLSRSVAPNNSTPNTTSTTSSDNTNSADSSSHYVPRLERLAQKFGLSKKEMMALVCK